MSDQRSAAPTEQQMANRRALDDAIQKLHEKHGSKSYAELAGMVRDEWRERRGDRERE